MAHAVNAHFIRGEGFVFSHVADEGWIDACAGELLRYRRNIGADNILVFTDVKKKHRLNVFPLICFGYLTMQVALLAQHEWHYLHNHSMFVQVFYGLPLKAFLQQNNSVV